MTAIITVTLTIILCNSSCADETAKPGRLKRLFSTLSWEETHATVASPRDAVLAVNRHIKYKPDIGDSLTSPEKAWEQGYGDCEDIAHAIVDLCERDGNRAWVEVFYSSESFTAHAVAMGITDGQMWIGDGRLIKVKDMDHARKVIASHMRWKVKTVGSRKWSEMTSVINIASTAE